VRPFLCPVVLKFHPYRSLEPVGQMNGVVMQRAIGVVAAAVLMSMAGSGQVSVNVDVTPDRGTPLNVAGRAAPLDVAALLTAARGAPPLICSLAAQSVRNYGWGNWSDAPSTPLGRLAPLGDRDQRNSAFPAADVERLLAGLASDDACVREIAVRLLGSQKDENVARGLIDRLGAAEAPLREVAAFGLGMLQAASAVDPLIRALRDASAGVRANAAWALGHIENGRALAPLIGLFRDTDERVREAAVAATGRMDSTSAATALIRVVQQDPAPSVRRVAAWALGHLEVQEAADALAGVLARDSDPHVREMSAWALGSLEGRAGVTALAAALRRDADDRVRETAAWALGQAGDRAQVQVLGAAAGDDRSSRVRGTAAWAIGQLRGDRDGDGGSSSAPAGLLRVLKDDSEDARVKAAWALGQIGDTGALTPIRDALRTETSSQVRRALIRALIRSGGRSEQTLTELLSSSDPQVREAAVRGLAGNNSFNPWPWPWPRPRPFP
jgi:HEAT repeat protein